MSIAHGYLWHPDGTGVQPGGDAVGGDIQRGDSYSVRFIRDDMPGSLLTVTFYAVEYGNCPGEFVVQRQIEWLLCSDPADPGGTEIWSDYEYDDISPTVMDTAGQAEQAAREVAAQDLDGGAEDINWNGQPFRYGD
jgi:hypothetical protein